MEEEKNKRTYYNIDIFSNIVKKICLKYWNQLIAAILLNILLLLCSTACKSSANFPKRDNSVMHNSQEKKNVSDRDREHLVVITVNREKKQKNLYLYELLDCKISMLKVVNIPFSGFTGNLDYISNQGILNSISINKIYYGNGIVCVNLHQYEIFSGRKTSHAFALSKFSVFLDFLITPDMKNVVVINSINIPSLSYVYIISNDLINEVQTKPGIRKNLQLACLSGHILDIQFSPDMKYVSYIRKKGFEKQKAALYVSKNGNKTSKKIAEIGFNRNQNQLLCWPPEGDNVLFIDEAKDADKPKLYCLNLKTKEVTKIFEVNRKEGKKYSIYFEWNINGIVVTNYDSIYLFSEISGEAKKLRIPENIQNIGQAKLSQDGTKVMFFGENNRRLYLFVYNRISKQTTQNLISELIENEMEVKGAWYYKNQPCIIDNSTKVNYNYFYERNLLDDEKLFDFHINTTGKRGINEEKEHILNPKSIISSDLVNKEIISIEKQ